ncbi:MAG: IPT/TIG domain-containing protein [Deltaproteobacteria bacterium]|nr:IPT/TIG domain-containing protein [Deltaproteobacteria bacterium]
MDRKVRVTALIFTIFFGLTVFLNPAASLAGNLFGSVLGGTINQFQNSINNTINNAPNAVKSVVNQTENSAISAIAAPKIFSVSPIYPTNNQRIVIRGTGFGIHIPFNGDSRFIRIYDVTRGWNAGWSGNFVTINVSSWTNSEIVINGFTGSYGGGWSFEPGDQVEVMVWNPQLAAMAYNANPQMGYGSPGMYNLNVAAQQTSVSQPAPQVSQHPTTSSSPNGLRIIPVQYGGYAEAAAAGVPTGAEPVITSVNPNPIMPTNNQTITIYGQGFGHHTPFNGDSPYLTVGDTTGEWAAGCSVGNCLVTLNVASWSNTKIVIDGLTGDYGSNSWILKPGDNITISVNNPQISANPAKFNLTVSNMLNTPNNVSSTAPATPAIPNPQVVSAVVNENTTSVNLPQGYSLYIYGYGTGGGFQSSAFIKGQYASAINSAGNRVAALAVSKSNFNEFSTQTGYQVAGGIAITGFSRFTSFSGYNTGSGASSASVSFNVKHNNSLVVVVAIAGGGQSLSITGLSGLKTDAAWPGSPNLAMEIVHTYLPKGSYSVSEITSQSAGGQNPNDAGNLIGAFVFY